MKMLTNAELRYFKRCERILMLVTLDNIANVTYPEDRFVRCYTYGKTIPPNWKAALKVWDASQPKPKFKSISAKWAAERKSAS